MTGLVTILIWIFCNNITLQDAWNPLVSAVTNGKKFAWLRQRLTGGTAEMSLMSRITEFVLYENPIDIEKLRKSLHYQVLLKILGLSTTESSVQWPHVIIAWSRNYNYSPKQKAGTLTSIPIFFSSASCCTRLTEWGSATIEFAIVWLHIYLIKITLKALVTGKTE